MSMKPRYVAWGSFEDRGELEVLDCDTSIYCAAWCNEAL